MGVLQELFYYLHNKNLLTADQVDGFKQLGLQGQREYWYRTPEEYYEGWEHYQPCERCHSTPCRCSDTPKAKGKAPSNNDLRADEIAKRVQASSLLHDKVLGPLKHLARPLSEDKDWLKKLHEAAPERLQIRLQECLKNNEITASRLWESLAFDAYRDLVGPSEHGKAAVAWRCVMAGVEAGDFGKNGWIIGRRRAINKVWQLVRGQNAVLKALLGLVMEDASSWGRWAERDFHPVGSLCLSVLYEALALDGVVATDPERRPEWSNWDGQRYRATNWTAEEASTRAWELAFRTDSRLAYNLLVSAPEWDHPLSLDSPFTHPTQWNLKSWNKPSP